MKTLVDAGEPEPVRHVAGALETGTMTMTVGTAGMSFNVTLTPAGPAGQFAAAGGPLCRYSLAAYRTVAVVGKPIPELEVDD